MDPTVTDIPAPDATGTATDIPSAPADPVEAIAQGISSIESGGADYGALGPITRTGDRAYGKYQVMGANIPSWTAEALGQSMTPQAFRASPDAQEKVARSQFAKLYKKFGNARDVASVWHSGVPYAQAVAEGRHDGLGTRTQDYADRVAAGVDSDAGEAQAGSQDAGEAAPAEPPPQPQNEYVALPDGSYVDLGVNPTPEMKAKVRTAILQKFPQQAQAAGASATTTATTTGPPAAANPSPEAGPLGLDDRAADMNAAISRATGIQLDTDSAVGRYLVDFGAPGVDAAKAVSDVLTDADQHTKLDTFDRLKNAMKLMQPLGVPFEVMGNVTAEMAKDMGLSPETQGVIGAAFGTLPAMFSNPIAGVDLAGREAPAVAKTATRALTGEAERAAATEASKVAQQAAGELAPSAEKKAAAEAAMRPTEVPEAGETVAGARKTAYQAAKADVQREYDAISQEAKDKGVTLNAEAPLTPAPEAGAEAPATPPARGPEDRAKFLEDLTNLREKMGAEWVEPTDAQLKANPEAEGTWQGGLVTGHARDLINKIEDAIRNDTALPYDQMEDFKRMLDSVLPFKKVPMGATPKDAMLYRFKGQFRDLMRTALRDSEPGLADRFDAANARWRAEVQPRLKDAKALADMDPREAFHHVFGSGTGETNTARAVRFFKDASPEDAANARAGFAHWLIDKASDGETLDPTKLRKRFAGLNGTFRDLVATPETKAFMKNLNDQATAAERASQWSKAATGVAKEAEAKGAKEAAEAMAPRKAPALAYIGAHGLELAAGMKLGSMIGHPYMGVMAMHYLVSPSKLAVAMADSTVTRLLARALKTPFNSPVVPAILAQLKKNGVDLTAPSTPPENDRR